MARKRLPVHGRILIQLSQLSYGYILRPVSARVRARVSKSNLYNGSCEVYAQEIYDLLLLGLPASAWYRDHNGELEPNVGACFLIDEWTYRHMVGGQSD